MTFWDKLATGEALTVSVPETARRKRSTKRLVKAAPFSDYVGFNPRNGARPRCRARGCRRHLRKNQSFACCPACEVKARDQLAALREAVEGTRCAS